MNLRHLKYFYWVSKLESYTRAAEQLDISEPSVFRGVQALERECGTELLMKERGRIRATLAGRLLQEYAEKIAQLESEAEEVFARVGPGRDRIPTFGVVHHFAGIAVKCLAAWKRERTTVNVGLVVAQKNELFVRLLVKELDFAFSPSFRLPSGLQSLGPVFYDQALFVGPPGHRLSKRGSVSPHELAGEPFVAMLPSTSSSGMLQEIKEAGVRLNFAVEVDQPETVVSLVASGVGIGVVSKYTAEEQIRLGNVSVIKVSGFPRSIPCSFVVRLGAELSDDAKSLINQLSHRLVEQKKLAIDPEKTAILRQPQAPAH